MEIWLNCYKIRKLLLIHRLKLSGIIHNSKTIMAISMTIQTKPSNILLKIITKINNELSAYGYCRQESIP